MTGTVDGAGRALLPITLRHPVSGSEKTIEAWIDTAFSGELVVPSLLLADLASFPTTSIRARLADGSEVDLGAITLLLNWLGSLRNVEVVTAQGQFPLLGTGLLLDRVLTVDYPNRSVDLK